MQLILFKKTDTHRHIECLEIMDERDIEQRETFCYLLINVPIVRWGIECICFQSVVVGGVALVVEWCKIKGTSYVLEIRVIIVVYIGV